MVADQTVPEAYRGWSGQRPVFDVVFHAPASVVATFAVAVATKRTAVCEAITAALTAAVDAGQQALEDHGAWGLPGIDPRGIDDQIQEHALAHGQPQPAKEHDQLYTQLLGDRCRAAARVPADGLEIIARLEHQMSAERLVGGNPNLMLHTHLLIGDTVITASGRRPVAVNSVDGALSFATLGYEHTLQLLLNERLGLEWEHCADTGRYEIAGADLAMFAPGTCQPCGPVPQRWVPDPAAGTGTNQPPTRAPARPAPFAPWDRPAPHRET